MKPEEHWKKLEENIIMHKDKLNIAESCVDRHASSNPGKLAFVFHDERNKIREYSYQELHIQINKFANLLNSLRIRPSSRIFIFLPKVPEMYIAILGAIKHGSIAIPLFEAFQEQGLELRLKSGDAQVLVTNNELSERISENIKKIPTLKNILIADSEEYKNKVKKQSHEFKPVMKNKKDTALMIFTSSTAGTPVAGIELPHYGIVQQHFTGEYAIGIAKDSHYWCTAHPGWVTGSVYGILVPLSIGCTTYVYQPHFDAKEWIRFIKQNKIDVIYTAPTALRLLKPVIKNTDLKGIKHISSVGEALTPATFEHYKNLGIEINDTYWQTETGAVVITNSQYASRKPGSIGKPVPGITAEIQNGEIVLKPDWPSLMTGIYKHPKMYESYFRNGWFLTHDMAEERDKFFFFKHRKDDVIKTRGERISPIEIESILMKHKSVEEAAVIGVTDKIKGNILKAFIVLNPGFKKTEKLKKELGMFVKKNYAGHAYPELVEFMEELPKTNSGKIIRMKLREMEEKK
jgi:acetyl-CoA synthetase